MNFSSLSFLFFFCPVVLLLYWLQWLVFRKNMTASNLFLCIASVVFYAWGGASNLVPIVLLISVNYLCAYLMRQGYTRLPKYVGIAFDCALLLHYKYPLTALDALSAVWNGTGALASVIFPLGISFIVFHCISYMLEQPGSAELSRGNELRRFSDFALYILFFPKVAQGPIVKWCDMRGQLETREFTLDRMCSGLRRFIVGLAKKVLIADVFGAAAAEIFNVGAIDTPSAWLYVIFFSLQIYLDFSGYSDMAIGIAKCFGFDFAENFNNPYLSSSISEFWRRWHISLGDWFRKYIYFPLGGSRKGSAYLNLLIVFLLTGLWHGSATIFILWGLAHGLCVMIEHTPLYKRIREKLPLAKLWGGILTCLIVSIGWLCFSIGHVSELFAFLKVLVGGGAEAPIFSWQYFLSFKMIILTVGTVAGIALAGVSPLREKILRLKEHRPKLCFVVSSGALLGLAVLCFLFIVSNGYSPFLYFHY